MPESTRRTGIPQGARVPFAGALLTGALIATALLVVAEFTTLFTVHVASSTVPIKTVSTGSHHSYALIPIAALVVFLAVGVFSEGSRPALLAIGLLGLIALLIALVGDLPDAHATGLIGTQATHYTSAAATPGPGLYLETAGAAILIIVCTSGFILLGPPVRRTASPPQPDGANG